MNVEKKQTETYVLTNLRDLDAVTVYVTNYALGQGKMVIECYGDAWAYYWGAMGERTLQQFVSKAENDYLLNKLLKQTRQTDFDEINNIARKRGFDICVTSDVEVAMAADDMEECFGPEWYMDLPRCHTNEYKYLSRILDAVKGAFNIEAKGAASKTVVPDDIAELLVIRECAQRLVDHADCRLGGALSTSSKAKEIPSKATSYVKARHLASLRAALDAQKEPTT